MEGLDQLKRVFLDRLEKKGLQPELIPAFLRDLAHIAIVEKNSELRQISRRLHLLGWDEFQLDYRTLELANACFDSGGLCGPNSIQ
jgi:hypothetical protein